ncbi:MAG: mucoidy inhibitor MuiA family protein [Planctomycetota bacterium]|nr:MAG: mucoidy inhibitor MuiA family protein [Planctomycetota bacterium]
MFAPAWFLSLAPAFAFPQEPAGPEPTDSVLDRVTVYAGRALVERAFSIEAGEPGPLSVEIGPLPLGLDPGSFQVRVEEGRGVIQGVEPRLVTGDALEGGERDRLRGELAELRRKRRDLDADKASIDAGRAMVDSLVAGLAGVDAVSSLGEGAEAGGLEGLFAFVRARSAELDRELAAYEAERDRLEARIEEVERRLGGGDGELRRYYLGRVQVWAEAAGPIRLRATYLVSGASWTPAYDVRVAPDLTGVTVGLVAEVAQRSGEDWTDAEVLLSTSTPSVGLDPPSLPLRVFEPLAAGTPAAAYGRVEDSSRRGLESEGLALADQARLGEAFQPAPETQVEDLGITALFRLPDRKTIRSDGETYRFHLREVPLEVRPERYVVPSRSDKAYLRAEVRLAGDTPLLPGTARIFLGPDFLGTSQFPVLRPGDSTRIHLGIDPNLSVALEVVRDERDDPGLLSSTVTISRVFRARLKLSAAAPAPVTVLVEEALPVSRGGGIEVRPVELRPAPLRSDEDLRDQKERGRYRWRLSLAPGQGMNVYWGYEVDFDEDLEPVLVEH